VRVGLGYLAYNGLLWAVGAAVLYAAGLLTLPPARLALAAGAAFVSGAATMATLGALLAIAGLELQWAVLAALGCVLIVALGVLGRRRGPRAPDDDAEPTRHWLALAAGLALYFGVQAALSRHVPPAWDSAHNWYLKAVALGDHATLDGSLLFTDDRFSTAHQTYPLAQPVLGGLLFQLIGQSTAGRLISELWILVGATVLAAPFLAGGRRRAWIALIPLAVAGTAGTANGVLRGDADVTMACFVATGALALARWVDDGPDGLLAPAVLCLAAATHTKDEGLAFALAALFAALAVTLVRARPRAWRLLGAGALVLVLYAPWRVWIKVHGPFASDVTSLSKSLDPSFLRDQLPLLDHGAQMLLTQLGGGAPNGWVLPFAVVLCAVLAVSGPRRSLAVYFLVTIALAVAAVLWAYWTYDDPDPVGHIDRTSVRTITGPLFLCAAALAHLLPRVVPKAQPRQ
jgi:hypothetical protein